ncbi:hypothetical protein [Maledivibacter halophilus]|uniref:Uncharacterized protein n=1 Tax=Maledivibacter halophilus TaxID=36842 RepID=A0A1T5IMD8_9FIRM|nr:hypothetical protein [Maledivibacter halophilus]SKC40290.1 hypothetical protein SAMN02194393_00544 [Maledivibacter halophilus]
MMLEYIWVAVFASFPEAALALLMGFNLSNVRDIKLWKILIVAGIQSGIALFVRMTNVYFGLHSIVQIITLYLLVIIFFKIKYYKAIIPVAISYISQVALQNIIIPIISIAFRIDIANLYYNSKKLILVSIPVSLIYLIFLMIIIRKNLYLCDIND